MRLPRVWSPRVAPLVAALLVGLAVAGCSSTVPGLVPPKAVTAEGQATQDLYTIVFVIAVVIFVIVEGLILFASLRYRRRPRWENPDGDQTSASAAEASEPLPRQVHGHTGLEMLWTGIPIVIVLFLFFVSWQTLNTVQAKAASPVRITVVGFQWQWQFVYPDPGGDTKKDVNIYGSPAQPPQLWVPVGETVEVSLKSQDVIHAFYVPQFLFKEDVVPGRNNTFQFKIDEAGDYRGQCAEFCGLGHAQMTFDVHAVPADQFDAWLTKQRAAVTATPSPAASGSASASGSAAPSGTTLQLSAANVAFDKKDLSAPANQPFAIAFDNKDSVIHNVTIHKDSPTGALVFDPKAFVNPGSNTTYQIPSLPAGTYSFVCAVHPTTMIGTLTVK